MKTLILFAAVSILNLTPAHALETYTCVTTGNSAVIPTTVQVVVAGNKVSGSFNFNRGQAVSTFGVENAKNDFVLDFADVSSTEKMVTFSQDGWDHYLYSMKFNDQAGVLIQVMQLDCSDEVQAQAYVTCTKK